MAVIINLREVFANDSQSEVSSKVNFNFNQLLALGIGQIGPVGPVGPTGAAGPAGPIGPQGPSGSIIFGQTTAIAPIVPPSNVPTGMVVGDILISTDKIYKKTTTGWLQLTDFNSLVVSAIGSNISPFLRLGGESRIIKPRLTNGVDLTNSITTSDPNYPTPGAGTNYQTVLYNFNELKTKSVNLVGGNISIVSNTGTEKSFNANSSGVVNVSTDEITISSHGFTNGQYVTYSAEGGTAIGGLSDNTGYYVLYVTSSVIKLCETANDVTNTNPIDLTSLGSSGAPHKLISYPNPVDNVFPATSNLALYSIYDGNATPAKEFETNPAAKGFRSQLELGSLDSLPTAYPGGQSATGYVISPSFENLRVRKYRIGGFTVSGGSSTYPGTYMIRAEYDLSSTGLETPGSFAPRRNSEHVWKINKVNTSQAGSRIVELKLTNSNILGNTESSTGISIDGIFLKRSATFDGSSGTLAAFGIGFNATNNGVSFVGSSAVSGFNFNKAVTVTSTGSIYTQITETGINGLAAFGNTWAITAPNNNMVIACSNSGSTIRIGTTSASPTTQAIKIKADRLDAGLPFPTTQVASADPYNLDDYVEGSLGADNNHSGRLFINRYYSYSTGPFTPPDTYNASVDCSGFSNFITASQYRYNKIGRLVTISAYITLDLNEWPTDYNSGGTNYYYGGIGIYLPYQPVGMARLSVNVVDPGSTPSFLISNYIAAFNDTFTNYVGYTQWIGETQGYDGNQAAIYLWQPNASQSGPVYSFNAGSTSFVSTGADLIRLDGHGLAIGQTVVYDTNSGTAIGGLTNATTYYVIPYGPNHIQLASSLSNAFSSTVINLTSIGSGTQFLTPSSPMTYIRPQPNQHILFDRAARNPIDIGFGGSYYATPTIFISGSYNTTT